MLKPADSFRMQVIVCFRWFVSFPQTTYTIWGRGRISESKKWIFSWQMSLGMTGVQKPGFLMIWPMYWGIHELEDPMNIWYTNIAIEHGHRNSGFSH